MKTILFATLLLACGAAPARADVPPDATQRLDAADAKFDEMAQKTKAEKRLPQLANPDERPVLEALWDERALLGAPPYTVKDMEKLGKITAKAFGTLQRYVFFEGQTPTDAHMKKYEDEVIRSEIFVYQSFAAQLPALADFVAQLPPEELTDVRKDGLKKMRLGMLQFVGGLATQLQSPGKDKGKALIAHALAEKAPVYAAAVTPDERKAYAARLQAALPSVPPAVKPDIQTFIDAMAVKECKGFCALQ